MFFCLAEISGKRYCDTDRPFREKKCRTMYYLVLR